MSKFNLKTYKKQDGDVHTNKALQVDHVDAPNQITDKQLEKDKHVDNSPTVTTEKQLKDVRDDGDAITIEGRLNKAKPRFDIKHRNEDAYTGDINKLEEKRVASDKSEDEKYELASDTPKALRWWETKTNDGLKLATVNAAMRKLSQTDEDFKEEEPDDILAPKTRKPQDSQRFNELGKMWGAMEDGVDDTDPGNEFVASPGRGDDFPVEDKDLGMGVSQDLYIAEKKDPIGVPGMPYAAYYSVGYDPAGWEDEDELRQAVINKIIDVRPDLEGKIFPDSEFLTPGKAIGTVSYYNLRLIGDEYDPKNAPKAELTNVPASAEFGEGDFAEIDYGKTNVGGTPMIMGKVKINNSDAYDPDEIKSVIAEFVSREHPEIKIDGDSIEIDPSGESATYIIADTTDQVSPEAAPENPEEETFEVVQDGPAAPENPEEETFEVVDHNTPQASSIHNVVTAQQANHDTKKK